jgi:hypothetical protein
MKNKLIAVLALAFLGTFNSHLATVRAATITVTSTADSGPGTLRAAISNSVSGDIINFSAALSGQTNLIASQIIITNNLTIDASALTNGLTVNGGGVTRLLLITNNATVVLNSLNLINGWTTSSGGGIYNSTNCTLTLTNCSFAGCSAAGPNGSPADAPVTAKPGADGSGGGIYNAGTVTLSQSSLYACTAAGGVGGNSGTNIVYYPVYAEVSWNWLPVTGGHGAIGGNAYGGGVYNLGTLTLNQSTLYNSSAVGGAGGACLHGSIQGVADGGNGGAASGGAVYNLGTLILNESTLYTDSAKAGSGGNLGLDARYDSPTAGQYQTSGNGGTAVGGGIYNGGILTGNQSTLYGCSAYGGAPGNTPQQLGGFGASSAGGIWNAGSLALIQCTIAANSTISHNVSESLAALDGGIGTSNTNATLQGCLIAYNIAIFGVYNFSSDLGGVFTSQGHNLTSYGSLTGVGDITGTPTLGLLTSNGGPTPTLALLGSVVGNPAIDAGDDSVTNTFAYDQRGPGFPRQLGQHVDIGAYEFGFGDTPSAPTISELTAGSVTVASPPASLGSVPIGASVNPNGPDLLATVWVEYGLSTAYGFATTPQPAGPGTNLVVLSQTLTNLAPGVTWHYRWDAANFYGTNVTADQTVAIGTPVYTQTQYNSNYTAGIASVTSAPNTYGLYTAAQLQALNVSAPLLAKNPTNGTFTLTIGVQQSPQLTNFVAFPMNSAGASTLIDGAGNLEFTFPSSNNAAFFRLQSQ